MRLSIGYDTPFLYCSLDRLCVVKVKLSPNIDQNMRQNMTSRNNKGQFLKGFSHGKRKKRAALLAANQRKARVIIGDHSYHTSETAVVCEVGHEVAVEVEVGNDSTWKEGRRIVQVNRAHYSLVSCYQHNHIYGVEFSLLIEKG